MAYKLSFSFVMDDKDRAELLALQVYTFIQQTEQLWALSGQLLAESNDAKAPINVILSHADMDVKTPVPMYNKSIDPTQMPSEIQIVDSVGQAHRLLFSGGTCDGLAYGSHAAGFSVYIPLDKGVKV